ncbi:MAG: type II toxin-antitoxin system HicA family toxin [PVC group bacterium]
MSKLPLVSGKDLVKALRRVGFVVIQQRGSHIRLEKSLPTETLKVTIPDHKEIAPKTLASILSVARISKEDLRDLLR